MMKWRTAGWASCGVIVLLLGSWIMIGVVTGDPVGTTPLPSDVSGTVYYVSYSGHQILKQAANLSGSPEVAVSVQDCEDAVSCITRFWVENGTVFYVKRMDGTNYVWAGDQPLREFHASDLKREEALPGISWEGETVLVEGKPAFTYPGNGDSEYNLGYIPRLWSPDGRFLAFSYSGYKSHNFERAFLALLVPGGAPRTRGYYLWDRTTGQLHQWVKGYQVVWIP